MLNRFLLAASLRLAGLLRTIFHPVARTVSRHRKAFGLVSVAAAALAGNFVFDKAGGKAQAGSANAVSPSSIGVPRDAPKYLKPSYLSALASPLQNAGNTDDLPGVFRSQTYENALGASGIFQQGGDVSTADNAFFQRLGTNGRTCFSCHKPDSGMSVSAGSIRATFNRTSGHDPMFAPVDGADCPSNVPASETAGALLGGRLGDGRRDFVAAHSLILNKGLFRVFLPVPKQTNDLSSVGSPAHPTEFTISVVSDPNGCNTDPAYATFVDPVTQEVSQMVSVYRRPRMSSNLPFATVPTLTLGLGYLPNVDIVTGELVTDPATGQLIGGNTMWDGREPTLESQARSATLVHAQALAAPTAAQIAQIVAFEKKTFAAQARSKIAGDLTGKDGSVVYGGPQALSTQPIALGPFAAYDTWTAASDTSASEKAQKRASIARGEDIFNNKMFSVSNTAGFNNARVIVTGTNPQAASCTTCHSIQAGTSVFPKVLMTIGTGGQSARYNGPAPSKDLPIFKLTCKSPYTTPYDGSEVLTNDPGMALITGRCADIGRKTVPQIRAMASRAPYFSDGSAATLMDVVEFYNKRYSINFTDQEKKDLVSFLEAM
jgi:cytochrome c peroxidase